MNKIKLDITKFRARCSFLIDVQLEYEASFRKFLRRGWIENEKLTGQGGEGEIEREGLVVSQVESPSSIIRQVMIADKPYTPLDEL